MFPCHPYFLSLDGETVDFAKVCFCTGALPKLIHKHPNIIGLRDIQSVDELSLRLKSAKRVVIVGNGGIALELVYTVSTNIRKFTASYSGD